ERRQLTPTNNVHLDAFCADLSHVVAFMTTCSGLPMRLNLSKWHPAFEISKYPFIRPNPLECSNPPIKKYLDLRASNTQPWHGSFFRSRERGVFAHEIYRKKYTPSRGEEISNRGASPARKEPIHMA